MPNKNLNNPLFIPSPQDVLAQVRQQRQQMLASGSVPAMHQAITANALDGLFGNPQVKQAQAIQERVKTATANMSALEGDDDVSAEIRRLSAIRDAVSDLDPNIAMQAQQQIMQLGTIKMERDKLKAQTASAEATATRNLVTAETALNKDARDTAAFPVEIERTQAATESSKAAAEASRSLVLQRARERLNLMNPETGHMITVKANNEKLINQLAAAGYVEAGKPTLQGSKADVTGLTAGDTSKELKALREQAIASGQFALSAHSAMKLIDANPNAGTLPAGVANFTRTAKENLLAAFRANNVDKPDLTKEGVSVDDIVANSLPRADAQLRGMVTVLVYAQARAADPGGRLSNQDVEMFAKQFGSQSPQQMRDTLARLLVESESKLSFAAQALGYGDDQAVQSSLEQFRKARQEASPASDGWKDAGNGVRIRLKPGQQ